MLCLLGLVAGKRFNCSDYLLPINHYPLPKKMPTFTEFFQIQALKDKLPFGIDFEIKPVTSGVTEEVGTLSFSVLNDLTSREAWFFECLESLNGNRTSELQLVLRNLGKKLQKACGIKSLKEAINLLFDPSDEIIDSQPYQDFSDENQGEIERLIELFRISQDSNAVNWLRVTFFILSRTTTEWTLGDTVSLTNKQIDEILAFISKEANGGVVPEPKEEVTEAEDSEGKKRKDATGQKSTGK
jgi:hypothetical protein